jgi:predicted hotdog family 3-hydroxylacyl-ACP dehydratase
VIVAKENITTLIPQRPPFVMVDQLMHSDDTSSRTNLVVTAGNIFVENGVFTEPGMLENIAQTAAARAGYSFLQHDIPVQVGYIGAVKNFEVFALPQVNETIETEVVIVNQIFDVTVVTGTIKCGGRLMAQCEMKIFIPQTK